MDTSISRKINILEVNSSLIYAGGQRNMVSFAKYFDRNIFEVSVGIYGSGGPLEKMLVDNKIPYVIAEKDLEKLFYVIKEKNIDVVHIHRSGGEVKIETEFIKGAKKINPGIIVIEKNVFGKYDPSLDGIIDCSFFQSAMHLNERYLSDSGLGFDFDKMKVLNNIVDSEEFEGYRATSQDINTYKTKLGIKPDEFVIGKVARPGLEKWSDLLIDMMPYLVKLVPNIKIVIIGPPPSRISRINSGKFAKYFCLLPATNNQKELHLFYQMIDVLAHSSKIGECNGNTINEAMFWKKPVVVNSTPRKDNGQLEQVLNGINGFVANKPATFARALAFLVKNANEREKMGEAGAKQIKDLYNPRFVVSQVEKFILEKISRKSEFNTLNLNLGYANIKYCPSAEEIIEYKKEYQVRLNLDFGKQNFREEVTYWLRLPVRLYYKVKDFVQHKWQSYVR